MGTGRTIFVIAHIITMLCVHYECQAKAKKIEKSMMNQCQNCISRKIIVLENALVVIINIIIIIML